MNTVGKNVSRLGGAEKVTGRALYVDDIEVADMWHGAVVRSAIPHGRVKKLNLTPLSTGKKWLQPTQEISPAKIASQ